MIKQSNKYWLNVYYMLGNFCVFETCNKLMCQAVLLFLFFTYENRLSDLANSPIVNIIY